MKLSGVELLDRAHLVDGFDCGSAAQSAWLRHHAVQAQGSGTSRVYVVCEADPGRVVAHYALAAGSVAPGDAPARLLKGAGRYDQPVVLLTRLGVDLGVQGQGLGRALLVDALRRVAVAAEQIGVRALLLHCESESAKAFYRHWAAFEESPTDPLHLILLLKDLRQALRGQ